MLAAPKRRVPILLIVHFSGAAVDFHHRYTEIQLLGEGQDSILKAVGVAISVIHREHDGVELQLTRNRSPENRLGNPRLVVRRESNESSPTPALRFQQTGENPVRRQELLGFVGADAVSVEQVHLL